MQPAPKLSGYPSKEDAAFAAEQGFGYGSGNEDVLEGRTARVLGSERLPTPVWEGTKLKMQTGGKQFRPESAAGQLLSEVLTSVDDDTRSKLVDLTLPENKAIRERLGTTFSQAALAATRNPVAALGFDPKRTVMDVVMQNANIGGAYSKKTDSIYANLTGLDPSSVLHESIHRGLQKLRETKPEAMEKLKEDLPGEEMVVRYLMYATAGDPEKGIGSISDAQREESIMWFEKSMLNSRYKKGLKQLESLAAEAVKEKRPRGPI